jgi:hypothetical protein
VLKPQKRGPQSRLGRIHLYKWIASTYAVLSKRKYGLSAWSLCNLIKGKLDQAGQPIPSQIILSKQEDYSYMKHGFTT